MHTMSDFLIGGWSGTTLKGGLLSSVFFRKGRALSCGLNGRSALGKIADALQHEIDDLIQILGCEQQSVLFY